MWGGEGREGEGRGGWGAFFKARRHEQCSQQTKMQATSRGGNVGSKETVDPVSGQIAFNDLKVCLPNLVKLSIFQNTSCNAIKGAEKISAADGRDDFFYLPKSFFSLHRFRVKDVGLRALYLRFGVYVN